MTPRPNDDAWVRVPTFAGLAYLLLLAVVLPQTSGSRLAAAGWLALPAVIAVGAVTLVAASSRRRWSWKTYAVTTPGAVAAASVLAALVLQATPVPGDGVPTAAPRSVDEVVGTGDDGSAEPSASADPSPTAGETASTARLVTPPSSADWTRLETPADLAADAQIGQWTQQLYGISDVAVGSYSPAAQPGVVFRYVGVNGRIPAASPEAAGRAALVSVTGSSVAAFPPLADGWLGCNSTAATGDDRLTCAWVGEQRAVFLRFEGPGLSMARAAAWTRSFRDAASEG